MLLTKEQMEMILEEYVKTDDNNKKYIEYEDAVIAVEQGIVMSKLLDAAVKHEKEKEKKE